MLNRWIAVAALSLASGATFAAPVTLTASGQVVATDTDDGIFGISFAGPVSEGTPVSVSWTFDLDLYGADLNPDPNAGAYQGGGISARVQVGDQVFEPPNVYLSVFPQLIGPGLTTYSFGFLGLVGPPGQQLQWNFSAAFELASANPSSAVPTSLNPAELQNLRLEYLIQQGFNPDLSLDQFDRFEASLTPTPVPLPAAGWLLFAGMGGFSGRCFFRGLAAGLRRVLEAHRRRLRLRTGGGVFLLARHQAQCP